MAKLQSNNLVLEIKFYRSEEEWVGYNIIFYWKDDIIIDDKILKRKGDYWYKRDYGTFIANDYQGDHLIDTLKKVLETGEPEYWEPIEPDVRMGIYPGMFFPFLKSHWTLVEDDDEKYIEKKKQENDENSNDENSNDKNPDDIFTIITMIDTYNLKDSEAYSNEGISLHIIATRKELEKFVADLEIEYSALLPR